jgi:hypothetical protein
MPRKGLRPIRRSRRHVKVNPVVITPAFKAKQYTTIAKDVFLMAVHGNAYRSAKKRVGMKNHHFKGSAYKVKRDKAFIEASRLIRPAREDWGSRIPWQMQRIITEKVVSEIIGIEGIQKALIQKGVPESVAQFQARALCQAIAIKAINEIKVETYSSVARELKKAEKMPEEQVPSDLKHPKVRYHSAAEYNDLAKISKKGAEIMEKCIKKQVLLLNKLVTGAPEKQLEKLEGELGELERQYNLQIRRLKGIHEKTAIGHQQPYIQ